MKLALLFTAAFAACTILFTACDKKEAGGSGGGNVSERDALENFKMGILVVDALAGEADVEKNPGASVAKMKATVAKANQLKTDGLPADLKNSFLAVKSGMNEALTLFQNMPETEDGAMAFVAKLMSDPATAEKMQKLRTEDKILGIKLKETAAKYGIELKNVGKDN